jgi:DNA-binding transcriptional LysR family regulator
VSELRRTGGRLSLAATPGVSTYTLPAVLEQLMAEHPTLNISVRTGHSEDVLRMVLADEVHLGLGRAIRHAETASVPLYQDELVLVVGPAHPWALLDAIPLEGIGTERIILFDRESSYYELTNALFRAAGIAAPKTMELDNIEAAKRMAERGLGVALLPRAAVLRDLAERRLRMVPVEGGLPIHRPIVAFRRRDSPPGPAAEAFLAIAARVIGPYGEVPPPARAPWTGE